MSIGKQLVEIRKVLKISQEELANDFGCKQPTVSDYEKDRITVPMTSIKKIANKYKINLNWLIMNEGPMFLSGIIQDLDKIEEIEKNIQEKLSQELDDLVQKRVREEMSLYKNNVSNNITDINHYWFIEIQGELACGDPMPFTKSTTECLIPISKKILQNPDDCDVFRVNGESMQPEIEHSDLVIIKKETNWQNCNNKIVAVNTTNGLTLTKLIYEKKNNTSMFVPLNQKYPPIVASDSCKLYGYLVHLMRHY
jgi:SOS-response transcriptional repressor LexA